MPNEVHRFPLIELAVTPQSVADGSKLASVLASLAQNDPGIFVSIKDETGETALGGTSEHCLDDILAELKRQGIEFEPSGLQIAYRETITRKARHDYSYENPYGGACQFARVILEIEPNERTAGNTFESRVDGDTPPKLYVPGVENGVNSVLSKGPPYGFPIVDLKVTLVDVAYHPAYSSAAAFEIAARAALREAFKAAGPVLLEPVMKVEVTSPEEWAGSVIGDLNTRRGLITGSSFENGPHTITGLAPLANMFGYINRLRSMIQGLASYKIEFSHYEPVPPPPEPDDSGPDNFPPAIGMRA